MIIQTNSRARQGPQIHVEVKVYNLQVATIVHGVVSGFFLVSHSYAKVLKLHMQETACGRQCDGS